LAASLVAERVENYETVRVAKDGAELLILCCRVTFSPMRRMKEVASRCVEEIRAANIHSDEGKQAGKKRTYAQDVKKKT